MRGTIRNMLANKGFGFILMSNGHEIFFHASQCKTDFKSLQVGDQVEFETENSPKGKRAIDVIQVVNV